MVPMVQVGMRRRRRSRAAVAVLLCGLVLRTLWSAAVFMRPATLARQEVPRTAVHASCSWLSFEGP